MSDEEVNTPVEQEQHPSDGSETTDIDDMKEKLDIKEITEEFEIKVEEPRGLFPALLITFLFTVGPIAFILDLFIPNLFAFLPFNSSLIFAIATGIFLTLAIGKAINDYRYDVRIGK